MSSPEKLAEAVLLPGFAGTTAPGWLRSRVADGLGGVILFGRNVVDDEQVAALTAQLRGERDGVVVGIDEEGGDVTRLDVNTGSFVPGPLALGAADDPELTTAVAAALGERLAACGVTINLAPCADLTLAAEDPIIGVRAFGSDPVKASPHVAAYVTGLQKYGVAACAKHFPGHGAATEDSHVALPVLPRTPEELREIELVPFAAAIRAGVRAVMTGHLVVRAWGDEPATLNRVALTDVLRGELGFTGAIITDALEMGAVSGAYGRHDGLGHSAVRALIAGADALCIGGAAFEADALDAINAAIVAAVTSGSCPSNGWRTRPSGRRRWAPTRPRRRSARSTGGSAWKRPARPCASPVNRGWTARPWWWTSRPSRPSRPARCRGASARTWPSWCRGRGRSPPARATSTRSSKRRKGSRASSS